MSISRTERTAQRRSPSRPKLGDDTQNPTYTAAKSIAYGMFGIGLGLSVTHTFDLFHTTLGAGVMTAAAVPVFVDGFQLMGRMAQSKRFAESTRKTGRTVQLIGAAISLAANVIAGHTLGDRIAGAIFVIGYIAMELFAERLAPVEHDVQVVEQAKVDELAAKRSAAATKAAATRKANAAKKASAKKAAARAARTAELAKPMAEAMAAEPQCI